MKKILLILMLGAIMCLTCACGNGDGDPKTTDNSAADQTGESIDSPAETDAPVMDTSDTAETEPAPSDEGYTLSFEDGKTFPMGEVSEDTVAHLGEWLSYAEAPSCIHPGMDKIYTFDGFDLTTSPDADGRDCIYEVAVTSDAVAITGGLTIGSSREVMESTFGTDYTEQFGVVRYELDEVSVSVILDGDFITSIVITVNW